MKKIILFFTLFLTCLAVQATSFNVSTLPGELSQRISIQQRSTIQDLVVTGTIDVRDFILLRDSFQVLSKLDLSSVSVVAHTIINGGDAGIYPANTIPANAFYNPVTQSGKSSLIHLDFPTSINSIGTNSFNGCSGMDSILLPSSVLAISESAFSGCSGYFEVVTDNPVYASYAGMLLNKNQSQLIQCPVSKQGLLLIPSAIVSIGVGAFKACTKLTGNLLLPATVTSIGYHAFEGCSGFTGLLKLPASVTSVGAYAFSGCTGFTAISAPSLHMADATSFTLQSFSTLTLTGSIDARDFKTIRENMSSLTSLDLSGANIIAYTGTMGTAGTANRTYPAAYIPDYASFSTNTGQGFSNLSSLKLPSALIGIGVSAFKGASALSTLTLPESITAIGSQAFADCSGLRSLTAGSLHIGDATTFQNSFITTLKLTGTLDARDFYRIRTSFSGLLLADLSTATIAAYAGTEGTLNGQTRTYAASEIPACSFFDATLQKASTSLSRIVFPSTLLSVADSAFLRCTSLKSITLPATVTRIGQSSFQGCNKLDSLFIPASLVSIGDFALAGCSGLFLADATNPSYSVSSGMLFSKDLTLLIQSPITKAGTLSLPLQVVSIGDHAFQDCSLLNGSLVFPSGLKTIGSYGFANCSGFTGLLNLPLTVTSVGAHAFDGCTGLTMITAPSLHNVDLTAFSNTSMTKLSLNGTIDARDFRLFRDFMPALTEIDLTGSTIAAYTGTEGTLGSSSQTYLANVLPINAFFNPSTQTGRTGLLTAVFPTGVTEIGAEAFRGCTGLTSLSIPTSVEVIGGGAFRGCTGLKGSLVIPSTVTSIGASAFEGCSGFTGQLTLPESVTAIGSQAFADCSGLRSLTAASLHIGDATTFQNTSITTLKLTGTLDARDFYRMRASFSGLLQADLSTATIAAYAGTEGTLNGQTRTYVVSEIPVCSFYDPTLQKASTSLSHIVFPSTLLSVADSAFLRCTSLKSITLPATVTRIGQSSFQGCNKLDSLFIPASLVSIGDFALAGCSGLFLADATNPSYSVSSGMLFSKDLTLLIQSPITKAGTLSLPLQVVSIGDHAFQDCSLLNGSLVFPSGLKTIGSYGFANCSGFTGLLTLPSTVTSVGAHAFDGCTGLTMLTAPSLHNVDLTAFTNTSMTKLSLNGTIDARDFRLFRDYMPALTEIDLTGSTIAAYTGTEGTLGSSSQTYLSNVLPINAFFNPSTQTGRTGLLTAVFPTGVTEIGAEAFRGCTGLTSLFIPTSVEVIGGGAFRGCTGLKGSLVIPSTVTSIGASAFEGCSGFTGQLTLPESITAIGARVFADCSGLSGILTISSTVSAIGASAFENCTKLTELKASVLHIADITSFRNTGFTKLTLSGAIDARDFKIVRDNMTLLTVIDLNAAKIDSYIGNDGTYSSENKTYPATTIPDYAFYNPQSQTSKLLLKSIQFPQALTSIGKEAFRACTGLTVVSLPTTVETIGEGAFRDCSNLISPPFTSALNAIGSSAFQGCSAFTGTLQFPTTLSIIESYAFYGCTNLSKLVLPNTVTSIGTSAFEACSGVSTLICPSLHIAQDNSFPTELQTVSLTSSIDARDFRFMRDLLKTLSRIDLSVATISSYVGAGGTAGTSILNYPTSTVPANAFYLESTDAGKLSLTEIVFPTDLETIDASAFRSCSNLSRIQLPASLTRVGRWAFHGCIRVDSVFIPNSVKIIESDAFSRCSGQFLVATGNTAFSSLHGLLYDKLITKVIQCPISEIGPIVLPTTLSTIGKNAFLNCSKLTGNLFIPSHIKSIESGAFSECFGLTGKITIASESTHVAAASFAFSNGLDSLQIPMFKNCDSTAFNHSVIRHLAVNGKTDATDFKYMRDFLPTLFNIDMSSASIGTYTGTMGPSGSENQHYPSDVLPDWAFCNPVSLSGNSNLTHFLFPSTVYEIGGNAFRNCQSLTDVQLPSTLNALGEAAFRGCKGLVGSLEVPSGVSAIQDFTWEGCTGIRSLKLQNTIVSVGFSAFEGCTALDTLLAPSLHLASSNSFPYHQISSLKLTSEIDARDFKMMRDLMSDLHYADLNTAHILSYLGNGGTKGSAILNYSKNSIPENAFFDVSKGIGCIALNQVLLPAELDTIAYQAFRGCLGMNAINIPATVRFIGNNAFLDFGGPITVNTDNAGYSSMEGVLYNKVKTRLIQCPVSFKGLFLIPFTVTTIEDHSVMNCNLMTEVKIPASVHDIETAAFSGCSGLEQIHAYRSVPIDLSSNSDVFSNVSRTTCKLSVPDQSLSLYEKASVWKEFLNTIFIDGIYVDSIQPMVIGCDNELPELHFNLLSGVPDQYRIVYGDSAQSAGFVNTSYKLMPAADSVGLLLLTVPLNVQPGIYPAYFQLRDSYGLESALFPFNILIKKSSDHLHTKFDDVVLIEDRFEKYQSYQWYKDELLIEGATAQFYRDPKGLIGAYSVELTDLSGRTYQTCSLVLNIPLDATEMIQVNPSPVSANQSFTVRINKLDEGELKWSKMTIIDVKGSLVYEKNGLQTLNELSLNVPSGLYIGTVQLKDGQMISFEMIILNR